MDSRREWTFDDLLDALGHVQRRKLLISLLVHNPQDDNSVVIDRSESDDDERGRRIAMRHVHLPKLESYGLIVWDQETNEVSKGPNFEAIRPLLELLDAHEDELPPGWL